MNSRASLVSGLCLVVCAFSIDASANELFLQAPTRNCDGSRLSEQFHYEIYFSQKSRTDSGVPAQGSCNGPGIKDFNYENMRKVGRATSANSSCTVPLDHAGTWYISAVTVTASGTKSQFSNEYETQVSAPGPFTIIGCTPF